MNAAADDTLLDSYRSRIHRVMDYIEENIEEEFTLDSLAAVACFSKYHFHRIFYTITGESLFRFIQRLRIEKAAMSLIHRPRTPVTEIAFSCGFSSSAVFSRVFRSAYGMSASAWRKNAAGNPALPDRLKTDDRTGDKVPDVIPPVSAPEIRVLEPMTVVYVRHTGPYKGNAKLFERLFARLFRWAGPRRLVPPSGAELLVIYHDDPEITDERKLRLSVCLPAPTDPEVSGEVGKMSIPGGRYAFIRFTLRTDRFQQAWNWVYSVWFPESGYEPDDRCAMERYPKQGTSPAGTCTVDICVPVAPVRR